MNTNAALHLALDILGRIADRASAGTLPRDFDDTFDRIAAAAGPRKSAAKPRRARAIDRFRGRRVRASQRMTAA